MREILSALGFGKGRDPVCLGLGEAVFHLKMPFQSVKIGEENGERGEEANL